MDLAELTGTWDYGELPANVRVGEDCYLEHKGSFRRFASTRQPGLTLGRGARVYTWTMFNVEPSGVVKIGDESVLVGALLMCAERITIGRRVLVSHNVTLADCDFHPLDPDLRKDDARANAPEGDRSRRPALVSRPVTVEDDVWIGIGAIILKGVRIGAGARVGAGAVVTCDVPAGQSVIGNPGQIVGPTEGVGP